MSKLHPSDSPLAVLILAALVYVATVALLERRGLWIIDNQIKFLQVQQIVDSNARDYSMPWAGAQLDPELRFQPMVFPFHAEHEGKLYPAYSPVFPLLSAVPFAILGMWGLYLWPLLGGILTLLGVARLCRCAGLPGKTQSIAVLLAGLLTPLWFYSAVFWEHSMAVAACLWGVSLLCRFHQSGASRPLVFGSALCAVGIYFRDDLYVFCAALVVVTALSAPLRVSGERPSRSVPPAPSGGRTLHSASPASSSERSAPPAPSGGRTSHSAPPLASGAARLPAESDARSLSTWSRRFRTAFVMAAAMGCTLIPLWIFQGWAVGHPFGFHIGVHVLDFPGLGQHFADRVQVVYALFVQSSPDRWTSIAVAAPFLVGFAIRPRLSDPVFRVAVPFAAFVALAAFIVILAQYARASSPLLAMLKSNSVFAASPILIMAFLRRKSDPPSFVSRFIWKLLLAYAVLYCLVSPVDATEGIHWGNRLLLVVYPLFAAMAAEQLMSWNQVGGSSIGKVVLGVTAAAALAGQIYSITLLDRKQEVTVCLNEAIGARTEQAILTDVWWAPLELYTVFRQVPIFLVDSQAEMTDLLGRLATEGYDSCLFLTEPDRPASMTPVAVIEDHDLHLRSLKLFRIDLTQ